MFSALRLRPLSYLSPSSQPSICCQSKLGFFFKYYRRFAKHKRGRDTKKSDDDINASKFNNKYLTLPEIEKVLEDVKADDVKVIPVKGLCDWTDFLVIATGRSTWHVRNIAEALVYETKQKQRGAGIDPVEPPALEGQSWGNWIIVDYGPITVHAFDEDSRDRFALDQLYTEERSETSEADVRKIFEHMFVPMSRKEKLLWKKSDSPVHEEESYAQIGE